MLRSLFKSPIFPDEPKQEVQDNTYSTPTQETTPTQAPTQNNNDFLDFLAPIQEEEKEHHYILYLIIIAGIVFIKKKFLS